MAKYGYEHVADQAQRYLAAVDTFRAEGATPTWAAEQSYPTEVASLDEIIDRIESIGN